jgi:CRP-like cAMP-binding protein
VIPQPIDTVPLFQRLSGEERQLLIARLKPRQVAAGELIITEGALATTLFIITSGWVKLESGSANHPVILANLGAGSLIGDMDMLLGRPYSMTARAAANTQLLALSRSELEDLVDECPSIGLKFSASAGVRLSFLENHLVQQRLRNIELLSSLAEDDLRAIAQLLEFRSATRGEILFEIGEPGDAVFILEEGQVRLVTRSADGETFEDLKEGAIFGHAAMLTGKPYPATARAITDVTVWILARADYQALIRKHPAVKLALSRALAESLSERDQADAVERLRQLQMFADVPTDALSMLAARLVLRHIPADEAIYTEGTPGDAMYIVDSGQVRLFDSAFSDAQILERLRPGEAFGEMALLTGRTRAECARAAVDSTVWVLYKSDFDDLMVQYPTISVSLSRALTQRLASRESDFVIRHLRRITLFSNLATSELKEITKRVRGLRFRPGEIVCFAGQPAQTLYLIEKGEIKRMLAGPMGEPIMFDILDAGDSFGEQEIVQNTPLIATAQAMTETELWTINKSDFVAMMEKYPPLALTVSHVIAERMNRLQRLNVQMRQRPGTPPPPMRPNTPVQPHPVAPRQPANATSMPAPRIQRPPSGARPIKTNVASAPVAPKPVAPKPTPVNRVQATPSAVKPVATPSPKPPVQAARKPIAKPATPIAPVLPQPQRRQNSFFSELGMWARGLSFGAKMRVMTLGALLLWFTVIALPWTTITTVSSAVGGLQLSNADETASNSAAMTNPNPLGGGRPKIAFVVPTNTPLPTRTPQPTFTPQPQPTRVLPTRTPVPAAAPVVVAAAVPTLPPPYIDPRLGTGPQVLPHLDQVKIIPANVAHGQKFWRVTSLKFEDITESGNDHTIYIKIFDESGKRTEAKVKWWGEGSGDLPDPEQKTASDICDCNYGLFMFGDGYGVKIVDQYPSDQVTGMIMPMRRHVNYKIQYQLTTMP